MYRVAMKEMITNEGQNLENLTFKEPVLLIFLRPLGCLFCQAALFDIASEKDKLESKGFKVVLVHMGSSKDAHEYLDHFGLSGLSHISDPECKYYNLFGLAKSSTSQLMGLKNWVRGYKATLNKGVMVQTKQIGDGFQMPGVFVLRNGMIIDSFIHSLPSDKPDYDHLTEICSLQKGTPFEDN